MEETKKISELEIFRRFLRQKHNEHTIKALRIDLNQFGEFLSQEGIRHFKDVKKGHLKTFLAQAKKKGGMSGGEASKKTVARKLASIRDFFQWLSEESIIPINPTLGVKIRNVRPTRETTALSQEEAKRFFNEVLNGKNKMHIALISVLLTTGVRQGEIANIKGSEISFTNGKIIIKIKRKGGAEYFLPLRDDVARYVHEYRNLQRKKGNRIGQKDYFFQSIFCKKISPKGMGSIVKKYASLASIPNVTTHSLRATFITYLFEQGHDLYQIMTEVGHKQPSTTIHYHKRRAGFENSLCLVADLL